MKKQFQTISPVDGRVYVERAYASHAEISSVLTKAENSQREWGKLAVTQRVELCRQAVIALLSQQEQISEEISWQMGRPLQFAAGELKGFAERANHMLDIAPQKLKDIQLNDQSGYTRFIKREPLGVVFSIVPWNYPYLTAVNTIIPALVAGNSVVMKPSTQTPLCAERLYDAFRSAGLPEGVFQILYLDHPATTALIKNTVIQFVAFTGSVKGGAAIQHATHERFIGVGLELGGKDPAYVHADVDLSYAIANLVDGVYFNSGQSCCAVERIYVHESVYDKFVDEFISLVKQYQLGDPLDLNTTLGPMAKIQGVNVVRQHIDEAVRAGAKTCVNPSFFVNDQTGANYIEPQILLDVDHSMKIMKEESFGPVVGIMKVKTESEAVALMNDSEFGLTASIWTENENTALELGAQVQTGTWFMNRCDYLDPALAWTGLKNSGHGCTLSEIGYEQLTQAKSFHLRVSK